MMGDPFFTAKARTARKPRRCSNGHAIHPGDRYIEHKEFPGGDAGHADSAGHPVRMSECGDCAKRYGRGDLIGADA